jgi:hypothetical protein
MPAISGPAPACRPCARPTGRSKERSRSASGSDPGRFAANETVRPSTPHGLPDRPLRAATCRSCGTCSRIHGQSRSFTTCRLAAWRTNIVWWMRACIRKKWARRRQRRKQNSVRCRATLAQCNTRSYSSSPLLSPCCIEGTRPAAALGAHFLHTIQRHEMRLQRRSAPLTVFAFYDQWDDVE